MLSKTHVSLSSPRASARAIALAVLSLSVGVADLASAAPAQPASPPPPAGTATPPPADPAKSAAPSQPAPAATPAPPAVGEGAAGPGGAVDGAAVDGSAVEDDAAATDGATAPTASPVEATGSASPLPTEPLGDRHLPSRGVLSPLDWPELSGQGVSLGYESGLWGSWWEQGLRVGVPFGRHFGVHLRALYVSDTSTAADVPYTADLGGRVDVIGRSLPLFNVMRLYGGGGIQVFQPVVTTEGRDTQIGGGGHFGFEFFCFPQYSFFLEVGGQGGRPSAGATILAGMAFYPWTE